MKTLNIALATALLATGGAATAQTATDAQCIILGNAFAAQAKDPKGQKIAEAAVYFYLGRISNSMTAPQLKALLDAQTKTLNNENAGPTMQKCAAAIQAKVDMLETAGGKPANAATPAKPAPGKGTPPPGR
ncbi:hypothetical protein [Sphingomonas alba]|uniref:Uncharacterized protein n=1 Tax=Sphingomonas alba TaxID=2908208 RepID=A0ABT0RMK4_9SPHN|nr:hypothetical protein [Sphingomonas alba]MCL6683760.1 hypothetical protein [Sphingomonas alba]